LRHPLPPPFFPYTTLFRSDPAVLRDPVDRQLGPADHEVGVDGRDVHPLARLSVEDLRDAEAVGDVARRVLVVERVEERRVRLARSEERRVGKGWRWGWAPW